MPKAPSADRARRLLALLGTLERGARVPLEELSHRLGFTIEQIAADLELLSVCGVAPYGPDDLVPVLVDGDAVHVFGSLPALDRRVRLSPAEARALATALQVAGRSSSDPLVDRLLEATSEADPSEIERVVRSVATADFTITAVLAAGAAHSECVRIVYRAVGADAELERVVEPASLFNERGNWYVEAYCRRAGARRTFRADRIRSAERTGERFEPREVSLDGTAVPAGPLPVARIRLEPGVAISEREWPGMRVLADDDSGTLVELPYAGTGWIAREVLSLLGRARVEEPAEVRDAVALLAESTLAQDA